MSKNMFLKTLVLFMLMIPCPGLAQSTMEADSQSLLSAFASYTDLRISSVQQAVEILAATDEAKSGRWESMKRLLSGYQKTDGGELIAWYVRPDGKYYTVDKGLMEVTLRDRSYFPELMSGRKVIGALVVSKSTGQRSAVIAVPVMKGGTVVGAIGISVFLDKLSDRIASVLSLRQDASFFSLAPNGMTTLHKKTERHFLDPRELGSPTLKKATEEMLSKNSGQVTYEFDNTLKKVFYRTSPLTQWKFAIISNAQQK
ncbi:MAG: cache domain-containing protein [Geobacteraceae bacterium]